MVDGRCGSEDQSMYSRALLMQGKGKFNSVIAEQSQSKLRKYILARTAADKSQPYHHQSFASENQSFDFHLLPQIPYLSIMFPLHEGP